MDTPILPNPIYRQARFVLSAPTVKALPADQGYEVAFVGRSNAGKSTAINAITDNKSLTRVSKQPGRTQAINVFAVSADRALIDLPGYGYANVAKSVKARWQAHMTQYLEQRRALRGLMVVMDARHPLTELDLHIIRWTQAAELPVHCLLTKADKLRPSQIPPLIERCLTTLRPFNHDIGLQPFSGLRKQGVADAHAVLDHWFELPPKAATPDRKNFDGHSDPPGSTHRLVGEARRPD